MPSVSIAASAAWRATPWLVDNGRPNCSRSDTWAAAMARASSPQPSTMAQVPTRARSSTDRVISSPSPSRRSSGPTATWSNSSVPWISRLVVSARVTVRPSASSGTTATRWPSVSTGTTTASATPAAGTATFVPLTRQPAPSATPVRGCEWSAPAGSVHAPVRIRLPWVTPSNHRARCASEPWAAIAHAPSAVTASSGTGATRRPCCSRTRLASTMPRPRPPSRSGSATPTRPASARASQRLRSKRSSVASTSATRSVEARSPKIRSARSARACWSALRSKSTVVPVVLRPVGSFGSGRDPSRQLFLASPR